MNAPAPRVVLRWLAPLLILGAAFLGSLASDWLLTNFLNAVDISLAPILWATLPELLVVGTATTLLARAEPINSPILATHFRHSLLIYAFAFVGVFLVLPDAGHTSHAVEYFLSLAAAALVGNAFVLWFIHWRAPGIEA